MQALSTDDLKNIERALKIYYSIPDSDKMAFFWDSIRQNRTISTSRLGFFDENFELSAIPSRVPQKLMAVLRKAKYQRLRHQCYRDKKSFQLRHLRWMARNVASHAK